MPQNQTEHKLKITADARDVRQATRGLSQDFKDLTLKSALLVRAMKDTSRGTEEYKRLRKEIKGVGKEAKIVEQALENLGRVFKKTSQQKQSFFAGLAQGAGIAQYIPTGPGMAARMGGAVIGGMGRRMIGGAAAPFMTPGMEGMQRLMQSIPGGGAMAAALGVRAQMFQQAVGFSKARQAALPYAGGVGAFGMQEAMAQAAKERARGIDLSLQKVKPRLTGVSPAIALRNQQAEALRGAEREGGFSSPMGQFGMVGAAVRAGKRVPAVMANAKSARDALLRKGFSVLSGGGIIPPDGVEPTPIEKTMMAKAAPVVGSTRITGKERERIAEARAKIRAPFEARASAMEAVSLPGAGFGVKFGIGPQQMMQALGGFMQSRGGVFTAGAKGQFEEALAAQTGFGVSAQVSGGYARQKGIGGGMAAGGGLSQALQSAVVLGLRGSRAVEYLQQLVSLGTVAEKRGVKFDDTGFARQTALIKSTGIAGSQAQRIAGGLTQNAMDISERGVQSPADLAIMRAAGFDPKGGRMSYIRASNKLEGGMTPDMLNNLMGMVTQSGSGSIEEQAFYLKRLFGRGFKTSIGSKQATKLLMMKQGGASSSEIMKQYEDMASKAESAGSRERLIGGAAGMARKGAGLAVRAAGLDAENIALGGKMATTFINIEKSGRNMAITLGKFDDQMQKVTKAMVDFTSIFAEGNLSEKLKKWFGVGGKTPSTGR